MQEPQKSVKKAVTQLIGVIVKHELPHNGWPDVLQFICQRLESRDLNDQEVCKTNSENFFVYFNYTHLKIEKITVYLLATYYSVGRHVHTIHNY